jgi:hypothetical protein
MPVIMTPPGYRDYYMLLGSTYVHGIMHGEAIPEVLWSERSREFAIR